MRRLLPAACLIVAACSSSGIRVSTSEKIPLGEQRLDVTIGLRRDPNLASLVADISPGRIRNTDSILVAFGTRHAMSDTISATRGIGAARRFIYNRLAEYSRSCG